MKTRLACLISATAIALSGALASGQEKAPRRSPVVQAADAVIVRPIAFTSTLIGSVFYVVSLPVTAPLKKSKPVAEALVVKPARATFQRPLGDMDALSD